MMPNVEVGVGEDGKVVVQITGNNAQSTLSMTPQQAESFSEMLTEAVSRIHQAPEAEPEIVPTHTGSNSIN